MDHVRISPDWALLERHLTGDTAGDEFLAAERFLQEHPELRAMFSATDAALAPRVGIVLSDSANHSYRQLAERLGLGGQGNERPRPPAPLQTQSLKSRPHSRWLGKHALQGRTVWPVGILAGITICTIVLVALGRWPVGFRRQILAWQSYTTASSQLATIRLLDGSHVVLAPNSRIRYQGDERGPRVVELQGQARFTVAQREREPFLVRTGGVTIRVLGTTFHVRHHASDATTQVAVTTGRVAVTGARTAAILTAGMFGTMTDSTVTLVKDAVGTFAGQDGRLLFTNTSVSAMLQTLGRWYGYHFQITDSTLARQRVTIGVSIDRPREGLAVLKDVLDVTMTFNGTTIVLSPQRRARVPENRPAHSPRSSLVPSEVGK
jgi:transmembrane sensor